MWRANFGLRIRDSKSSDTGSRGHSDPMDVDAVSSLSSSKGKGSSSPRDGCFKCGCAHCTGKQSHGKGKQSKSWSKSEPSYSGKGKSKENKRIPKDNPKEPKVRTKVPKAYKKAKHRKLVTSCLETRNRTKARKLVEYHPIFAKDLSILHQFGPEVLPGTFLGYVLSAG